MTGFWSVPRCFEGRTVAVLASGPSMSREVAEQVRAAGVPAIVTNNTWQLAPWAWALYAADAEWWAHESNRAAHGFAGHRVSLTRIAGVHELRNTGRRGFDPDPSAVRTGSTSGYQAVHVAVHTGAARVLLCGFDYRHTGGEKHWHGDHVAGLRNTDPDLWPTWVSHFDSLRDELPAGCEVINCTPGSAIGAFRRMDLETALVESTESATP